MLADKPHGGRVQESAKIDRDCIGRLTAARRLREGRCFAHNCKRSLIELRFAARAADARIAERAAGADSERHGNAAACSHRPRCVAAERLAHPCSIAARARSTIREDFSR